MFTNEILDILQDLKENYNISGLKSEFEAEGACFDEVMALRKLSNIFNLNLTLKIAGCEAIRDMIDAKTIKPNIIVAPMIESSYAMKKFVDATDSILAKENMGFYINIETELGYQNFDSMLISEEFKKIDGVVLGRSDMNLSLGNIGVESNKMFQIVSSISEKTLLKGKKYIVGGSVGIDSIPFLKQIALNGFETRKVVFDNYALESNIEQGIEKAILFEKKWLEYKQLTFKTSTNRDKSRLELLSTRV